MIPISNENNGSHVIAVIHPQGNQNFITCVVCDRDELSDYDLVVPETYPLNMSNQISYYAMDLAKHYGKKYIPFGLTENKHQKTSLY